MKPEHHLTTWRIVVMFCGTVGMILIGWHAEQHSFFHALRTRLQQRTVPSALLSYGPMGKILRRLDKIQVLPNDYSAYTHPATHSFQAKLADIHKKRRIGIQNYGFRTVTPEEMPGSTHIPPSALSDPTPLLSIVTDTQDLFHPSFGLLTNPFEKGRDWERPAYISYFQQGKLLFATGAGIRIHGGVSRDASKKSFRVYLRDIYGASQFQPGILFDKNADPVTSFVVRSGAETSGIFVNSMAFDIARRLGAIAPHTQAVRLFLNGEPQGVYILIEHIQRGYLAAHFGHEQFLLAQTKRLSAPVLGSRKMYQDFLDWASARTPLAMAEVRQNVDLDNLSRWIIAVLFCSTPDALQGPILRDLRTADAKWFWINWDMDHSLVATNLNYAEQAWEEDIFTRFYLSDARSMLYHRLRLGSPEFRHYFTRLFMDSMNHRLTKEFLEELSARYAERARDFELEHQEFNEAVSRFFARRKSVLREQMKTYFDAGDSYRCRVIAPDGVSLEIDGHSEPAGYSGWYFEQMPVTITLKDTGNRSFSHWQLNGKRIYSERTLRHALQTDTTIEAVF